MKKKVLFTLAVSSLTLTSCFTTRYVNIEPEIKSEFMRADVDDVEYRFGDPQEVQELRNGYAYTYYFENDARDRRGKRAEQHIRFAFNKDGYVRDIQGVVLEKRRKFDAGGTVVTILFFTVALPASIIAIAGGG
jgi:hypothetical protein